MPWLADLVESSEGSFNVLPVQCLCEFLLNSTVTSGANALTTTSSEATDTASDSENVKQKKRKQKHLLLHLQNILQHQAHNEEQMRSAFEILDYFMRRLSSQETHQRLQVSRKD